MLLIKIYMVAHAELFIKELQRITAFEIYDPGEFTEEAFSLEAGESIDIHFEATGYESANVITNLGIPFYVILLFPLVVLCLFLLSRCKCCGSVSRFAKRHLDRTFFNGIIMFIDGSFLLISVCCLIHIYQVREGAYDSTGPSYYLACGFLLCSIPYILVLVGYLCHKFPMLRSEKLMRRVGDAYSTLAVKNGNRIILGQLVLSFVRSLALSLTITYGRYSATTQRVFMSYAPLFMIGFTAMVRSHKEPLEDRLELFNEFTMLVLYGHCIV